MAKQPKSVSFHDRFFQEVQSFAAQVTKKFSAQAPGEPEDQLRTPVDTLFSAFGDITLRNIVLKGESALSDRLGKPDFAAHDGQLPIGYIELKAPGKGANPALYKGHDREQWKRFKMVPNILYSDGNEWALYRTGDLSGNRIRLSGNVCTDGKSTITTENAKELFQLFADFTTWQPIVPKKPKALSAFLAPFCRLIREEVLDALKDSRSPVQNLKNEIRKLLFPEADDMQFADEYAQTVMFALLLAQMEGADVLNLSDAYDTLASHHLLLSRSLQFLTDPQALKGISSSLSLAQRVIHEIPKTTLKAKKATKDPWLFFYEDFLAAYDPKLRKEAGVYYTPLEVIHCQVRLVDEILNKHLDKEMGFIEPGVVTLDPAVGTGTYLLGIIEHALKRVAAEEGPGAVKSGAKSLVHNLHGFEWMVGPYAVAQLRFTRALRAYGATIPASGPGIYLTNTLESPHTKPPAPALFHKPIAQEHERALKIKDAERVLVCLGNPPYGRHEAVTKDNHASTGGWVRHGDESDPSKPILEDFLEPARRAGYGVHLKNLYNHYVYFIRWSLWKVFEHKTATGPGILSFITASSYFDGDAFVGLREHMRKVCDHIDIIDLGGEGRGTRQDDNVFAIQTPVAIFIGWRKGKPHPHVPATLHYTRIEGAREEKLSALDHVVSFDDLKWQTLSNGWQDTFRPKPTSRFSTWPNLTDLFPWQQSGVQFKRLWPIAPDAEILNVRWERLVSSANKAEAFKETRDRKVSKAYPDLHDTDAKLGPLVEATIDEIVTPTRYAYRSFDRQWILPDNRLGDYLRPPLWQAHSERQVYLSSMFNHPLGSGPAITVCANIPDLHHFRGSFGAKEVLPLYRDAEGSLPNVLTGLPELLTREYGRGVSQEEFTAYVYGLLAQPEYTSQFAEELDSKEVRVPLTKDGKLFFKVAEYGQWLIWLHTYGERMTGKGRPFGRIPKGKAKCTKAVLDTEEKYPNEFYYTQQTNTLHVGDGCFGPVSEEVFDFEVSGLKVVQSWLGYRMRQRSGRKSSPLDEIRPKVWTHEFTRELLELLWLLEKTVGGYPKQKQMLEEVLAGDLFAADELPKVPDEARKPPKVPKPKKGQRELFK